MLKSIRRLLEIPEAYRLFQERLGFAGARKVAFDRWLTFHPGMRILDIGCGPGHILKFIPEDVDYIGFDIDARYIEQARTTYGHRASFHCRVFDDACAEEFGDMNCVMLNGVLHHMSDDVATQCLRTAHSALARNGKLFTLDGCYQPGQSMLAKLLLDLDRGKFIRQEAAYRELVDRAFLSTDVHIADDLSPLPYTFIVMIAQREAQVATGHAS